MEIPECPVPEHAGSRVVRAGWYGKPPHRRQRWRCRPANGDPSHRFTPVLTRQGEPHAYCMECSTGLEPWEGQAGARDYHFAAREVGEALAAIAAGAATGPPPRSRERKGSRVAGEKDRAATLPRDGQIVANWIDVFTELICAEELPRRWPETLPVDTQNFRIHSGQRAGRSFHVSSPRSAVPGAGAPTPPRLAPGALRAQGSGRLGGVLRLLRGSAAGDRLRRRHRACLRSSAFGERGTEHRICEWHLGRKLREHLPDPVLEDRGNRSPGHSPAPCAPRRGGRPRTMRSEQRYTSPHSVLAQSWLERYGRIAAQVATRDPTRLNSTGPVEQVLREVDRRIGDRVGSFTNRVRMSRLLALMALDILGGADGREWADRLRERLHLADGHAASQRPHDDSKGSYSLFP